MAATICTIQASLTSAKESWMLSASHWRFTPSYTKQITCNIKLLQKESKSGEREYSIQYHIQLQDRLHNLHYIHTTIFILQYTQEKTDKIKFISNFWENWSVVQFNQEWNIKLFKTIPDASFPNPIITILIAYCTILTTTIITIILCNSLGYLRIHHIYTWEGFYALIQFYYLA